MGDYEQVDIRNGDRLYTSRNIGFTPVRIRELIGLLQFAESSEGLLAKKQKERVENGVQMICLRVEGESRGRAHDVCIDSVSHDILSDEWKEPPDEKRAERYTDYFDYAGHRYPRKLQLLVNGNKLVTANIVALTPLAFDQSLLVAPTGSIERVVNVTI